MTSGDTYDGEDAVRSDVDTPGTCWYVEDGGARSGSPSTPRTPGHMSNVAMEPLVEDGGMTRGESHEGSSPVSVTNTVDPVSEGKGCEKNEACLSAAGPGMDKSPASAFLREARYLRKDKTLARPSGASSSWLPFPRFSKLTLMRRCFLLICAVLFLSSTPGYHLRKRLRDKLAIV